MGNITKVSLWLVINNSCTFHSKPFFAFGVILLTNRQTRAVTSPPPLVEVIIGSPHWLLNDIVVSERPECIAALSFAGRRSLKIWKVHFFIGLISFPPGVSSLWSIYTISRLAQTQNCIPIGVNPPRHWRRLLPGATFCRLISAGKTVLSPSSGGTQALLTVAGPLKGAGFVCQEVAEALSHRAKWLEHMLSDWAYE